MTRHVVLAISFFPRPHPEVPNYLARSWGSSLTFRGLKLQISFPRRMGSELSHPSIEVPDILALMPLEAAQLSLQGDLYVNLEY